MKKTRLFMLVSVLLLSLALVGMALAADNAQKPNPPVQTMTTSKTTPGGEIQNIAASGVNFITPDTFSPSGGTVDLCFNVHIESPDAEYMDGFDFDLPDDWTVNSVTDVPADGCTTGHTYGVNAGNVVYWYTNGMPSGCGDWYYGDKNFCANVTVPAGCSSSWDIPWNYYGDTWGEPPHSTSGSAFAFCESPNVYLEPETQSSSACGGTAVDYTVNVLNVTGFDTTIDLSYDVISGFGSCTGPASVDLADGANTDITVSLTASGNPGDTTECQVTAVDASNPDFNDTAIVADTISSGGLDPAGWMLEPNTGAIPAQWQSCAVGTNPLAAGPVGYQIAGLDSVGGTQFNLQMYDPTAATWTQLAAAPHNWFGQVAGWIDGKLYVAGGSDASFTGNTDLTVYDPATDTWDNTSYADLPVARLGAYGGAAPCYTYGVGDCLYVMGGTPTGTFTDFSFTAYEYDPLANVWTQLTNIPGDPANYGTALGGGVACNGQVFVGGDYRGTADFFKFDTATGAWSQVASIPASAGKMTPAMVCVPDDNAIYLIGGDSLGAWGDLYNNKVFRYDIALNTWDGPLPQTLNTGLLGSCGLFMDSKLWTFGGTNGTYAISPAPHESLEFLTCGPTGPLQVTKAATPVIVPGDPIDYSITINNTSPEEVYATMVDPIPAGTTYITDSVNCDAGACSYDAGLNAILWEGTLTEALAERQGSNIDSLSGTFVTFDPTLGGATCNVEGTPQTFCFRAESFSPDWEYVYNTWLKFPTDWTVDNAYVVGTPVCDNGSWGPFSWSFESAPNELNLDHARYQGSGGAHCVATYCVDVTTGETDSAASWYWDGDGYANPPHNPCSLDGYTPASMSAQPCDEAVNPLAEVPTCGPTSAVTIGFQVATDGLACPSVVTNAAVVSSEGNPDVLATADTNAYCTLEPVIVVSPLSLFAEQPPDTVTSQQLQICNEGPSPLDWAITEVPGMKVTSVTPAVSSKLPFAINQPANVTRDPAIVFTPTEPTSEILLDQVPNQVNGIFVDAGCDICGGAQVVADNFALEATTTLEQVVMWTGYFSTDTPIDPDHIRVLIHQDAAGLPGTVVYDESDVAYTRVQTGVILFGVHEWMHTLTLSPFATLPPGNYWLEIYNDTGFGTDDFFWETGNVDTMGRGLFDSVFAVEAPGVNWIFPNGYEQALQLIGTIAPAEDIPWLSESPITGTIGGFDCSFVDVSFDSAGLTPGAFTGGLDVSSNDPVTPLVPVDVTLTVQAAPDISVDPLFLESTLTPNSQETQDLNVCNTGETDLDWSLTEVPGLKVNSVTPAPAAQPQRQVSLSLDANNIAGPTAPAVVVPDADVVLILDDGSRDNDIGLGGTIEMLWVNRFTPAPSEYPFQLTQVQIYFSSVGLVNVGDDIVLIMYENTSGNYDPAVGGNFLASFATTVQALDSWNVYDLPTSVTFNGPGDAIIGAIGMETPGTSYWPASIDQTATQARSWAGWWNASPPPDPPLLPPENWTLIDAYFPGNWMVRGYGVTGEDLIPWLSEAPTEGTVLPGDCVVINVTFDSTDLTPGTYGGSLDIASNDPDEPEVIVPVTLNVVVPDIVVTPPSLDLALFPNEIDTLNFNIENVGGADLDWSATEGATWLSLLPTSGTLLPGESVDVVATFDSAGLLPDVYEADITIASNDPDTPEVLLPTTLTVNPLDADLSLEKSASSEAVRVGDTITYTLEVSNTGPADAIGVTVVDTLPGLVTFVSASTGCVEAAGVVTCAVGDLAAEASTTLTIVVTADGEGVATNTAVVSSDFVLDPDLTNNTSSFDITISPAMYYFFLPIIQKS